MMPNSSRIEVSDVSEDSPIPKTLLKNSLKSCPKIPISLQNLPKNLKFLYMVLLSRKNNTVTYKNHKKQPQSPTN